MNFHTKSTSRIPTFNITVTMTVKTPVLLMGKEGPQWYGQQEMLRNGLPLVEFPVLPHLSLLILPHLFTVSVIFHSISYIFFSLYWIFPFRRPTTPKLHG